MKIAKMKKMLSLLFSVIVLGLVSGCVEPIDIETRTYENALVVEGTITDEFVLQEIFLSRTYPLEEKGPLEERNAEVQVVGNATIHSFRETEPGKYVSTQPFQAVPGVPYTLEITTSDGKQYASEAVELPRGSEINSLYAEATTIEDESGVAILADIQSSEETLGYYKYEFIETYKIVSPFRSIRDAYIIDGEIVQVLKTGDKEERICYATEESSEIILSNTNEQVGNNRQGLLIKFMNREDFRTAHRYSILVKQLAISGDAFSYYETLQDFSESENLFSQNQLGFINGNISSLSDPDEAVIGVFSVAAVTTKRIFFDFQDFYSRTEFAPDAHIECEVSLPPTNTPADLEALKIELEEGRLRYLGFSPVMGHRFARTGCIDCTVFGTNVPPDFWEE